MTSPARVVANMLAGIIVPPALSVGALVAIVEVDDEVKAAVTTASSVDRLCARPSSISTLHGFGVGVARGSIRNGVTGQKNVEFGLLSHEHSTVVEKTPTPSALGHVPVKIGIGPSKSTAKRREPLLILSGSQYNQAASADGAVMQVPFEPVGAWV
jgi:hypothetical protein